MRAAVLGEVGDDLLEVRDDVETVGPGPGEVLVGMAAAGVCHSDLSAITGVLPQPTPAVLGHEGAGTVLAVGEGVRNVADGDHVIIAWAPPCGSCRFCLGGQPNLCSKIMFGVGLMPRFKYGSTMAFGFGGTGVFAEQVVLPSEAVVPIPRDVPFDVAALIGCAVTTGVGAAVNCAKVRPGSSVVVFGCGGVGISTIQGARVAGAAEIVAVDTVPRKLEEAKRFGATYAVLPGDLMGASDEVTGGDGFDYAFEVIGLSQTIRAAYDATRRGGTTVIVGAGRSDDMVELSAFELFYMEKKILGTFYGSADVRSDFGRMISLWRAGRLDLEGLISRRLDISQVNEAFDAMRNGEVIRQVIQFT